jgi:hypothetical protein
MTPARKARDSTNGGGIAVPLGVPVIAGVVSRRTDMTRRTYLPFRIGITGAAAAALLVGAAVAQAETSQSLAAPPGAQLSTFTLSDMSYVDVLSYHRPRELQICNASSLPAATVTRNSALERQLISEPLEAAGVVAVPLQVSYRGVTDQVAPGECYRFDAAHVRIALAQPLAPGSSLQGTAEWLTPAAATAAAMDVSETSTRVAANSASAASESAQLEQIRHTLARDDQTIREATAELRQARRELLLAARDLRTRPAAVAARSGNGLQPVARSGQA